MKKILLSLFLSCFLYPLFGQSSVFRSVRSGLWHDPGTWEILNQGQWITANSSPDSLSVSVNILNGDTVTVESAAGANNLLTEGVLKIPPSGILRIIGTNSVVSASGVIYDEGLIRSAGSSLRFSAGARYIHGQSMSEGSIPAAQWDPESYLEIRGYKRVFNATTAGGWNAQFGHVIWNTPNLEGDFFLNSLLTSISGNLEIQNTNSFVLRLTNSGPSEIRIGRDLLVSGTSGFSVSRQGPNNGHVSVYISRDFIYTSSAPQGSRICEQGTSAFHIGRDFKMDRGTLYFSSGSGGSSSAGADLKVAGDFLFTGGVLDASVANSNRVGDLFFTGQTEQQFVATGQITGAFHYRLTPGSVVRIGPDQAMSGSSFECNACTLIVTSTDPAGAIQKNTTAGGNIRVRTQFWNSGATIIYGGSSRQFIGGDHPIQSGVRLLLDNPGGLEVSATGTGVTTGGDLDIFRGDLTVSGNNLTIRGKLNTYGGKVLVSSQRLSSARTLTVDGDLLLNGAGDRLRMESSTDNNAANAVLVLNGNLGGTGYLSFTGTNTHLQISGPARTFNRTLPVRSAFTLEQLTINSPGTFLIIDKDLTLGNFTASSGTWTGGVNALAGTLKMNAALKVNASATLTAGVIDISGQSAELRRNIRTAYPAGVFAADSKSVIRVTSDFAGTDNTIAFLLGKDTLGTLILNRSANFQVVGGLPITPHLKINSPLKIKSLLYLEDGELYHQSGLEMLPGSTIIRTTDAAFSASTIVAPGGKSRKVIYKTGVTSGGLLAGVESLGNLGTMISDLAVELDIKDSLRISDSLAVRSGSLTISSDPLNPGFVDLSGLLTVGPGVSVHTGEGRLLLRNDSVASMGRIGPLESGAQINGSITAQQFMPGKGRAYRYISAPVGGMRFRDLNDDFDYYPNYVWRYQESLTGDKNNGWDRSLTPDSALVAGRGYVLWPRSGYEYVNNTWDVTGPVVQGSFEFHLNFTSSDPLSSSDDGWNLLGNPYPSPVFWSRDLLQWSDGRGGAPVNIDPVVYIRDPAGVFRSWDAETGIGDISEGTGIIPAGTAFWVHATGPSPRLVIHERAKASSGGTFYRKADEIISGLKVSVSTEEQTASCFLLKRYGTNPDYERGLDVLQRPDSVLNISLVSRDGFPLVHYASEELPREIDLVFSKPGIDAVLQIFEIPGKLPVVIWLKDRTTGLLTELKPASSISIVSENDRYVLLTGEQSDGADEEEISFMITPNPVQGNTIRISGPSIAIKRIRIVDLTGRTVKDFANIMATENHIELATDLTAGLYHAVIYKERKTVRVRFVITNR